MCVCVWLGGQALAERAELCLGKIGSKEGGRSTLRGIGSPDFRLWLGCKGFCVACAKKRPLDS